VFYTLKPPIFNVALQKNRPSLVRRAISWHVQSSTNWQFTPDRPKKIIIIIRIILDVFDHNQYSHFLHELPNYSMQS
jgi:hypothetical protein